jgi:hypothetical protein
MKYILPLMSLCCIWLMSCRSSDKIVSLDLLNNSSEYEVEVKKKNVSFGPYYTGKSKRKEFEAFGTSILGVNIDEQKGLIRFELHEQGGDRIEVIALGKVNAKELQDVKQYSMKFSGNNLLISTIRPQGGVMQWEMVLQNAYKDLPVEGASHGVLTNGKETIRIEGVRLEEHPFAKKKEGVSDGYRFTYEGKDVAAVQTYTQNKKKKTIWINKSLPEDKKLLLAGACATLILKGKTYEE